MQIFVEALRELRKNSKLTESDLYDEMKAGKLMAKDILPLVGKAMSDVSRRGGALDQMLKGNAAAMRRLATAWQSAQNDMFKAGFGDALTKLFTDLAENVNNNSPLFTAIGRFFSGIIEFANDAFNAVNDAFILMTAVIDHYSKKWDVDLSKAFNWAGYAAGAVVLGASLSGIGKIIGYLIKNMRTLLGLMTLAGADIPGEGGGKGKKGKGGRIGRGPKFGGVLGLLSVGSYAEDLIQPVEDKFPRLLGKDNFLSAWLNSMAGNNPATPSNAPSAAATFTPPTMTIPSGFAPYDMYRANQQQKQQPVPVKVEISVKDSEFAKAIQTRIDDAEQNQINMIMGGGK